MSLSNCLKLHKMSDVETRLIKKGIAALKKKGYSARDANITAVENILKDIEKEQASILRQVEEQQKEKVTPASPETPESAAAPGSVTQAGALPDDEKNRQNERQIARQIDEPKSEELTQKQGNKRDKTNDISPDKLGTPYSIEDAKKQVAAFNIKNKTNLEYVGAERDKNGNIDAYSLKDITPGSKMKGVEFLVEDLSEKGISDRYKSKKAMFSRSDGVTGITVEQVHQEATTGQYREKVKQLIEAGRLKIVQKASELPKGAKLPNSQSDWRARVERQRELQGLRAAIKDPSTGKIYSGFSHQAAIEKAPKYGSPEYEKDSGVWGRLSTEWDNSTDNVGFLDERGNFVSRKDAERKWGILTMEDRRDALSSSKYSRTNQQQIAGAYHAADDVMYLVADGIEAGQTDAVLLHESLHRAVEQGEFQPLLDELESMSKSGSAEAWLKQAIEDAKLDINTPHYVQELAAYSVQRYQEAPGRVRRWVDKLIAKVKAVLFKALGLRVGKLDPAMLREIAVSGLAVNRVVKDSFTTGHIGNTGQFSESADIRYSRQEIIEAAKVFYSRLERAAAEIPESIKAGKIIAFLKSKLKDSNEERPYQEIQAIGLDAWAKAKHPNDSVSKQEIMDFVQANTVELEDVVLGEHGEYSAEPRGGEDWAIFKDGEFIGSVEAESYQEAIDSWLEDNPDTGGGTHFSQYTEPGGVEGSYREMFVTAPKGERADVKLIRGAPWRDGHQKYSDVTNPVARIRFNTVETADGKTVLRIEEVQGPNPENQAKMPAYLRDNIFPIAVKRILSYAKENGLDGVALATKPGMSAGETQAERYSLHKQIGKIVYTKNGKLAAYKDSEGSLGRENKVIEQHDVSVEKLPDYIGKEAAERLINNPTRKIGENTFVLSGQDLRVGGEGLKRLYDSTIPRLLEAYGKGKVETARSSYLSKPFDEFAKQHRRAYPTATEEQIKAAHEKFNMKSVMPFITITADTPASYPILSRRLPGQASHEKTAYSATPEELSHVEKNLEGKTAIQGINWLVANAPNQAYGEIASLVRAQLKKISGTKQVSLNVAHVGDRVPIGLAYSARGLVNSFYGTDGKVEIWLNGADVSGREGTSYETALHEYVHAATMGVVRAGNLTAFAGSVESDAVQRLYGLSNFIVKRFNDRAKDKSNLTDFEKKILSGNYNALRGPDEVLAWGLSSADMQDYLKGIKYQEGTLWSAFVDRIRRLLGLSEKYTTALDELLSVSEVLLQADIDSMLDKAKGHGVALAVSRPGQASAAAKPASEIEQRASAVGAILNNRTLRKAQKILTPGLDIVKGTKEGALSLLLPSAKSQLHLAAAETMRGHIGTRNQNSESAADQLRPHSELFDRAGVTNEKIPLKDNIGVKVMSWMSTGKEIPEKWKPTTELIRTLFSDRIMQLSDVGAALKTIRENYFPGMWSKESRLAFNLAIQEAIAQNEGGEDLSAYSDSQKEWVKNRVDELLEEGKGSDKDGLQYLSRRPFKGSESFRKAKVFDDIMTGVEFGLRPISNNPVELAKLKLAEMDTAISAYGALKEYSEQGKEKFLPVHEKLPDGWVRVNDRFGTVYGPPTTGVSEYVDKNVYDGLMGIAENMGLDVKRKMNAGRGKLGFASYDGKTTVSQFATELSVLAHEIGHQIDFKYDLWDKIVAGAVGFGKRGEVTKSATAEKRGKIQRELRELADLSWEGSEPSDSYKKKVRKKEEKMAHMLEAYIHAPDRFKEVAPTVHESFDNFVKNTSEISKLADIKQGLALKKLDNEKYVGLPIMGYRIVTKEVGDILNNYLSSSLYNNPYFGGLYKAYMGVANALNQTQLAGFFHAGFIAAETQTMAGADMIKDVFGVLRGTQTADNLLNTIKKYPTALYSIVKTGGDVLAEWRNPGAIMDPKISQVAEAARLSGAGFKMESGLRTDWTTKMRQDWYSKHRIRAVAMRSPVAAIELIAKPTLDWLVPRAKAGIFAQKVLRIIDRNPNVPLKDLTHQFNGAWNTTDASMGQVRYNRLFINNTAKNVMQGLIRAPGWTGGTLAQLGGAFTDTAAFLKEWKSTGVMPKDIPDRVTYTLSLVISSAVANALMTFALTGEPPEDEKDLFSFKTGNIDEHGRPERLQWPTYMKDIHGWTSQPGTTAVNKLHPLLSMFGSLIKNKDYFGTEIRSVDSDKLTQLAEFFGYIGKQAIPFSARNIAKEFEREGSTAAKFAPIIGITPAPSDLNKTAAEKLISEYASRNYQPGQRTKEQAEKSKLKRDMYSALRRKDRGRMMEIYKEGKQAGILTAKDYITVSKSARNEPLVNSFNRLSYEQAQKVFDVASEEEKIKLKSILFKKKHNYIKENGRQINAGQ